MFRKDLSGARNLDSAISSDDILGKEVIDAQGASVGIVDIVHIDPRKLDFVGLSVDEGLFRRGLVIGKGYIKKISSHAIFLNVMPAFAARGLIVFDKDGKYIGVVKDVVLWQNRNVIRELVVSPGIFRKIKIPGNFVASIGQNIFLKTSREELDNIAKVEDKK